MHIVISTVGHTDQHCQEIQYLYKHKQHQQSCSILLYGSSGWRSVSGSLQ